MIHKRSALISVADMKNCADFKMFFNNKAANKFRSGMNMMYDKNIRAYNKASNIKNKMEINSYQGTRHKKGLPVHGQRTSRNARTRKGKGKVVANKKKVGK